MTLQWRILVGGLAGIFSLASVQSAPLSAVRAHARVLWQGVSAFDNATAENAMSAAVRRQVAAGGKARDAVFLHPQEAGRAELAYPPVDVAPRTAVRVLLLAWAGLGDRTPLDDREHPSDGVRFTVRVNDQDMTQAAVSSHAWAPLFADLGPVPVGGKKAFSMTLCTDAGGAGNPNYDWALIGEPMLVSVPNTPLPAGRTIRGTAGVLAALTVSPDTRVEVVGVGAGGKTVPGASAMAGVTVANRLGALRFDFSDLSECVGWQWRPLSGRVTTAWGGSWAAEMKVDQVGPAQAVFVAGEPLRVQVRVRNTGRGALLPDDDIEVECAGLRERIQRLAPDTARTVSFALPPRAAGVVGDVSWRLHTAEQVVKQGRVPRFAVWPVLPTLSPERPARAELARLPGAAGWLLLQDRRIRWLINPRVPGMGALFWSWTRNGWQLTGTAVPLVELAAPDGTPASLMFQTTDLAGPPGIVAQATVEADPMAGVKLRAEFAITSKAPALAVAISASAGRPVRIGALRGPAVLAGDRATGTGKGVAIFPGLEYLDGDEQSSSTRDLAPPLNVRVVPHRFKVCVPMMLVETRPAGPVAAVIWDARQKWDGTHVAPAAAFASPNFVREQDNHLMQVFVPSTPDSVPENGFQATATPYILSPDHPLHLNVFVAAGVPEPDATGAFGWFDALVGFPPPESPPRSFDAEMTLCRHGFLHTVWDAETKHSRHVVGGDSGNAPGHATLLLMDGRAVARGKARKQVLDRVGTVAKQTIREEGPGALSGSRNCHIMAGEFPYHYGMLPTGLGSLRDAAGRTLAAQGADGGWGYTPDKRREVLGKHGARVLGIVAHNALVLARWAAISGDPEIETGLRNALRCMNQFVVPRGAQGWECPILEPDVLASASAVRAYVWAHMALDDPGLLDRARYWARTGLAFQYAWDDGAHPGMRYASIPVFGSTFFHHSWIGLPVQWCGLVYAYGLQELMRFDSSPWWRKQVEGITSSAMFQQWPMESSKYAGSYPDSFGKWFTHRNPVYINPEDIEVNLLALHGLDPGLRSRRLTADTRPIHVTAPCDFTAQVRGDTLSAELRYIPDRVVYCTIAPVAPPTAVTGSGSAQESPARRPDLGAGETGWAYDPATGIVAIGVRCDGRGRAKFAMLGLRGNRPRPPVKRSSWAFDAGAEGWTSSHNCRVAANAGALVVRVTGNDPYAISGPANIDAKRFRKLRVRARMTRTGELALFWRSSTSAAWGEDKHAVRPLPGDGQWHEVVFDMSRHPGWGGRILQVRLDPEPADIPPGARLEVDWIRAE